MRRKYTLTRVDAGTYRLQVVLRSGRTAELLLTTDQLVDLRDELDRKRTESTSDRIHERT